MEHCFCLPFMQHSVSRVGSRGSKLIEEEVHRQERQYYSERYPTLLRNSGILDNNQVNRKLDT